VLLYEHIDNLFPEENTSRKHYPGKQPSPLFYFCPKEEVLFSCRVKVEAEAKSGRLGRGSFLPSSQLSNGKNSKTSSLCNKTRGNSFYEGCQSIFSSFLFFYYYSLFAEIVLSTFLGQ